MQSFTSLVPRLERISRAAYGIVAALGALAIWGWALGVPVLRDLGADFAPMSPAAALAFVLLATSFFAAERGRRKGALAAAALATARPSAWLLDTLASKRTGAVVTRWLLPAAFVVPIAVGWMRLYAEREGLFGEAFGMALFTMVMIAWFSSLIIWVARTLDHAAAQRAQAEGAASEQREWLQVTLASIGDGVIATDAAGRVRFLNAAAQRLTGWRAADAAGKPIDELLELFDERDGGTLRNPLKTALETRAAAAAGGEPAIRARDGAV